MSRYEALIQKAWNSGKVCKCKSRDCGPNNHRQCIKCTKSVFYGAHESIQTQANSKFAWKIENGNLVHIDCTRFHNK